MLGKVLVNGLPRWDDAGGGGREDVSTTTLPASFMLGDNSGTKILGRDVDFPSESRFHQDAALAKPAGGEPLRTDQ